MKWKNYIFFKKWFLNHHVVSTIWKTETGFQYMVPAWAQANPAAQAKLERAKRSYNETSRGMGFAVAQRTAGGQKNLDSERSERTE